MKKVQFGLPGLAVLFVSVLTIVYWNHFDNDFHFDDIHTIVNNSYITEITNLPLFFSDSKTGSSLPTNQSYRPIITSLNAIDYWLVGKLDPVVFHWHIYLEFLLMLIFLNWLFLIVFEVASGKKHPYVAMFGTAFFAFHTTTAETLNYILSRSDGFSTFMVLVGAVIYITNTGWKKQLGLLPFIVGCLAKPTTLMLAPLLALYSLILESPSLTVRIEKQHLTATFLRAIKGTSSFFLVGTGIFFFNRSMEDTWTPGGHSVAQYLNTQPYIVWIYIKTYVLPTGLSADTDLQLIKEYLAPRTLWGLLVMALSLLAAWVFAKKRNTLPISFGILWFFVSLIPTSSVVPLAEVMNHHRTFFPYIGLTMAAAWGGFLIFEKLAGDSPDIQPKISITLLMFMLLGLHAYGTYQRNEIWDSDESLWFDVTVKSPRNGRGLMNYGLTKMKRGDYEGAVDYFERALETNYGRHPYLFTNLGIATNALSERSGDPRLKLKAEEYLKTGQQLGPEYPATHYRYADWLHQNDRSLDALVHVKRAIKLSPAHKQAQELLHLIIQVVDVDIEIAAKNAKLVNRAEAFLNLSLRYYELGYYELSIDSAELALQRKPDYIFAYNNVCAANNKLKEFQKAIVACEKALELDPDFELAQNNLRWARDALNLDSRNVEHE